MHVNVYGYSPIAAERFVIIDGSRSTHKRQLELKEIRENGFVVDYGDVVFKIRRP